MFTGVFLLQPFESFLGTIFGVENDVDSDNHQHGRKNCGKKLVDESIALRHEKFNRFHNDILPYQSGSERKSSDDRSLYDPGDSRMHHSLRKIRGLIRFFIHF